MKILDMLVSLFDNRRRTQVRVHDGQTGTTWTVERGGVSAAHGRSGAGVASLLEVGEASVVGHAVPGLFGFGGHCGLCVLLRPTGRFTVGCSMHSPFRGCVLPTAGEVEDVVDSALNTLYHVGVLSETAGLSEGLLRSLTAALADEEEEVQAHLTAFMAGGNWWRQRYDMRLDYTPTDAGR